VGDTCTLLYGAYTGEKLLQTQSQNFHRGKKEEGKAKLWRGPGLRGTPGKVTAGL
jgi:hypothetical protein